MTRPALVVRDGSSPFEVLALTVGVILGVFGLVAPDVRSAAIDLAWGRAAAVLWYLLVLVFATVGLWAVCCTRLAAPPWAVTAARRWPAATAVVRSRALRLLARPLVGPWSLRDSLQIERVAMYGYGWACTAYPFAAFASAGLPGATAAGAFASLSLATAVRIRHIHIDLRKLDAVSAAGAPPWETRVVSDPEVEGGG